MSKPPDMSPEDLARLRTTYALRRLSTTVQNSVLSDGVIAQRTGLDVSTPIRIPGGITVDRTVLFRAFQTAADSEPISPIVDREGVVQQMRVEIEGDSAVLTYAKHRVSFPQAALLAANVERRKACAVQIASNCTLTAQAREQFMNIIDKAPYTHDDFFAACNILASAPERFADTLRDTAKKSQLALSDFLPDEPAHWENLTARRLASDDMVDFINKELATERIARISLDPVVAVDVMSLTFGTFELVPLLALKRIEPGSLLQSLRRLLDVPDPYALAAGIDICAERAASDERFVTLGNELLDRLLSEPKRLFGELATFATAYVIATAHLSHHEQLRQQPVYWRRLAAAAHAALVTRVLGSNDDDEDSLLKWATRLCGKTFYISILNDAHMEPRWRPDWITPNFLAADIHGRLTHTLQRLGSSAPSRWQKMIDDAKAQIIRDVPPLAYAFPSLLQGRRAKSAEMPSSDAPISEKFEKFAAKPTVDNFLMFFQLSQAFGFPTEMRASALSAIHALRTSLASTAPILAQGALQLGAFIAAQNRDAELSDAVATVALERLVCSAEPDRLLSTATILIECAAATENRSEALVTLGRRLENMAFVSTADNLPEALDVFRILQSINEELSPFLARAVATAKLGMPRVAMA